MIFPGNEGLLDNFSRIFAIYPIMLCDKASRIRFHTVNDLLFGLEWLRQIFALKVGVTQRFDFQRRLGLGSLRIDSCLGVETAIAF